MLIFVDKRAPEPSRQNLRKFGEVVEFETHGITYEAISGHPDIFICQSPGKLIVAPNLPEKYFSILKSRNVVFTVGKKPVGSKYPETAGYNAVVTEKYLIHQPAITDPGIFNSDFEKRIIPVKQAYTRCNLVFLNENSAITSDRGIEKQLKNNGINTLYADPSPVQLPGFKHGFFGGACGIIEKQLFILGNLRFHYQGQQIRKFVNNAGIDISEIFDEPLYDGGAILFLKKELFV
jgi:hypothetical protein